MNPMDTVFWLLNFPASHGYEMVFLAGFSILGFLALSRKGTAPGEALQRIREREGMSVASGRNRQIVGTVRRTVSRVLAAVMGVVLIVAILGLVGVPVTRAYIFDHGRPTTATVDGAWITFTTAEGMTYTLENDALSPSAHPDRDAHIPSAQPVVVRYLSSHPQAFVIDSSQLPE
jgi:hypothetical protein